MVVLKQKKGRGKRLKAECGEFRIAMNKVENDKTGFIFSAS
jgi:hypothetical protein